MAVDNDLYNATGDIWWDDHQPLSSLRTSLNPARFGYIVEVLERQSLDPGKVKALDIGCGGGLLAEEVARLGCDVTGVDPSGPSVETARRHAEASGLQIRYEQAWGEDLPFSKGEFHLVYCCDVLEHVRDVDKVVSEAARVLRPGGVFIYDTINRTPISKLIMVKLFQDWKPTAWMPRHLHEWDQFIKPQELSASLARGGFLEVDSRGMKPGVNPLRMIFLLRQMRRGALAPADFGAKSQMKLSRDRSVLYIGHANLPA